MAYFQPLLKSVRKGQAVLECQLCELESNINWKCIDCKLMMCQRCRDRVHPKFPSAQDHTVIDIKDISQNHAEKLDFTKLKCGLHNHKYCCLYCKSCSQLVCDTCVAETHIQHKFCEISTEYQNKVDKLKERQEKGNKGLQNLTTSRQKLQQVKLLEYESYNKTKQEIVAHEKSLVDAIKKQTNKLLTELDQNWMDVSTSIDKEEEKVKETEKKFLEQNEIVNEVLQSNDVGRVFSKSLSDSMKINIPPFSTIFHHIPKFFVGDKSDISKLCGKFENVPPGPNIAQQYTTNLKGIYNILPYQDGSICINDFGSKVIQKVEPVGDTLKVMSEFDLCVQDMTLLRSGDLLLSVRDSSRLKLVPSGSEEVKDTVYSVAPLITVGIHMTAKNKVIIGTRNAGPPFSATGPRQVIVMDQTGQQENVFQYDSHNNPLFTSVGSITSNNDNNIAVRDRLSTDQRGRVVVINLEGEVRNIYKGHHHVNNHNNPFKPCDIVTTPSDNFLVAETNNHTLHTLNSEGGIITYFNTMEIGVELPLSLTFGGSGQLYIGCFKDRRGRAKIFVVVTVNFCDKDKLTRLANKLFFKSLVLLIMIFESYLITEE